jgi:hypothetical protein
MDAVESLAIFGALSGLLSLLVTFVKTLLDGKKHRVLKEMATSLRKIAESFDNELSSTRRRVEILETKLRSDDELALARIEVEKQKVALREREVEWRKIRDLSKAWKWFLEKSE